MGLLAIERMRGDTRYDVFTLAYRETRQPYPLTGWTFVLTVDPLQNPTDATGNLFALTGVILNEAGGEVGFAPSALQADHVGAYYYDVQGTDPTGLVHTLVKDTYTFLQDITK